MVRKLKKGEERFHIVYESKEELIQDLYQLKDDSGTELLQEVLKHVLKDMVKHKLNKVEFYLDV